jgi:hypothetical protein
MSGLRYSEAVSVAAVIWSGPSDPFTCFGRNPALSNPFGVGAPFRPGFTHNLDRTRLDGVARLGT